MTNLAVRDLTKTYGEGDLAVAAVRHVDLDVDPGEEIVIAHHFESGVTDKAAFMDEFDRRIHALAEEGKFPAWD